MSHNPGGIRADYRSDASVRTDRLKSATVIADSKDMDPSAIALQGLQQADVQLNTAAAGLASAGTSSPDGANLDVVDLSAEIVALMSAQNAFQVNLATLNTANQTEQSLINLTA
jgi:Flagellar basal body rod FlgEFG protein C-terminal